MTNKKITRKKFLGQSTLATIAISPFIGSLAKFLGTTDIQTRSLIDHAFRLSGWENMLHIEFYFINTEYSGKGFLKKKRRLIAEYGQEESYMIVRLPQQHIAEESIDVTPKMADGTCVFDDTAGPPDGWVAQTRIAGYSYLAFRIMSASADETVIPLTPEGMMQWDKKELFQLVVKHDRNKGSLFEIEIAGKGKENQYPLNYTKDPLAPFHEYNYDKYPSMLGTPVTAIEAPWRLFLSPSLPDSRRFEWNWEFSNPPVKKITGSEAELWRASLTIKERTDYVRPVEESAKASPIKKSMDEIMQKIELMIIGSPDSPTPDKGIDGIFKNESKPNSFILPNATDRNDLVELYIKYNLLARTDKLTFSPLGITTYIEFDNTKIEETIAEEALRKIYLLQWKQLISLGRDQEVEIVKLVLDKEAGHKYLHIRSAKRRTKKGLSYLDYREYIMPFTPKVDYTTHVTTDGASKFKSPFKSIEITELKPKRICPVTNTNTANQKVFGITKTNAKGQSQPDFARMYYPQSYDTELQQPKLLTFELEVTDWMDQKSRLTKKLQLIDLNINDAILQAKTTVNEINSFFDKQVDDAATAATVVKNNFEAFSDNIKAQLKGAGDKTQEMLENYREDFEHFRKRVMEWNPGAINVSLKSFEMKVVRFAEVKNKLAAYRTKIYAEVNDVEAYITDCETSLRVLENQMKADINDMQLRAELVNAIPEFKAIHDNLKGAIGSLKLYSRYAEIKNSIGTLFQQAQQFKSKEKEFKNQIELFGQRIAYTVNDEINKAGKGIEEAISNMATSSVLGKGALKTLEVQGKQLIDVLHPHASIFQLDKGIVTKEALNKIAGEKLWFEVSHAEDFVRNQKDLLLLDIKNNASKVVMEVKDASRQYLNGKIRQAAADMGGYINPELPTQYLTYFKDPKQIPDKLKKELGDQFPQVRDAASELNQAYNDVIFVSEEAKKTLNQWKSMKPADYFDLGAKLMGSISLKDIIGIEFELPRVTQTPDYMVYQFNTEKIVDKDLGLVKFYAHNKNKKAALQVFLKKSLRSASKYESFTRISDFAIAVRISSQDVLIIFFSKLEIKSSNPGGKKTEVKIDDIAFGGPLNFVGKLAEAIKIPGTGLRVVPSLKGVEIAYAFALPNIETPSFNFTNLKFNVGVNIPFPGAKVRPITTKLGINRAEDKFLITVGIFGGRGHFELEATPRKIVGIDAALEFGGYFGINLGIARGQVYLFAGIRYRKIEDEVILDGYLICGGGVTVFGWISVSVTFLMMLTYRSEGGKSILLGSASVNYSIKIGFFKKSFTLRYSKKIAGSKGKEQNPESTGYIRDADEHNYGNASLNMGNRQHGPSAEYIDYEEIPDDPSQDINEKSFTTIYDKSSWKQYCTSFHF